MPIALAVAALLISAACGASAAYALTREQDQLIDKGFKVFTKQKFKGNGRTCGTCHEQQFDFNINPADISTLSAHKLAPVLASKTPALENSALVTNLGLFNITNAQPGNPGNITNPLGPFRASMALGGLKFTTLNMCDNSGIIVSPTGITTDNAGLATVTMTEPMELFLGEKISVNNDSNNDFNTEGNGPGVPYIVTGFPGSTTTASGVVAATQFQFQTSFPNESGGGGNAIAAAPCPGAEISENTPGGVDDGNRDIELGWAGDGALLDPMPFEGGTGGNYGGAAQDCIDAINDFAANPADLFNALRSFTVGAVRHHFERSLNRIPGKDFRCPRPAELDAAADFQIYLGRQFELALCSNSSPSSICTGSKFGAQTYATGKDGTQTAKFSQNVSSLTIPATAPSLTTLENVITFNDTTAETGKAIFLDSRARCNLCHFNGGAQNTIAGIRGEPFIAGVSAFNTATPWQPSQTYFPATGAINDHRNWSMVTPTSGGNPDFFMALVSSAGNSGSSGVEEPDWSTAPNPGDVIPVVDGDITWMNLGTVATRINTPGRNATTGTDIDVLRTSGDSSLAGLISFTFPSLDTFGTTIPMDPGNGIVPQGLVEAGFNIQSIIEAPRKSTFFHNAAATSRIEDAASFYFTATFDDSIVGGVQGSPPRGTGGLNGRQALQSLAGTYTGGDNQAVLNNLGFFLRALSVVYSLADCERLVQDSIDRVNLHLNTRLPVANCTTNLNDVSRVILGAKVTVPSQYSQVQSSMATLAKQLHTAARTKNTAALEQILSNLRSLRRSIATISFSSDGDPICTGGSASTGC
jgi:hypothetical protein